MHQITIPDFRLKTIALSGQCFRLLEIQPSTYELVAKGQLLHIHEEPNGRYSFDCEQTIFEEVWRHYFDLDTDYRQFTKAIPRTDAFLTAAVEYGAGMKILRQDPWEMLITFLISQNKNIPGIKNCIEKLCSTFGEPLEKEGRVRYSFPSAQAMAERSLDAFCECSLGYRADYLKRAADDVALGRIDLSLLDNATDEDLRSTLLSMRGVGPKVADCVMLFGFHRLSAFPKDVWIHRVLDTHYPKGFPMEHYLGFEGVIQQYLFYYGRSGIADRR